VELDPSEFPGFESFERVGYRAVEVVVRGRRFRVTAYETLHDPDAPRFSANYEEEVEARVGDEWRRVLVKANLPWEAADTAEDCFRAALRHVERA
jgi:hypothetical protein